MTAAQPWLIRRLEQTDLAALRELRLQALRAHPEAFGVAVEEEQLRDTARLIVAEPGITVGGFAGQALIASAGFIVSDLVKQRHKGHVFGFYVAPEWRGAGIGAGLMDALIAHARSVRLRMLTLSVTMGNQAARKLYRRANFRAYGVEPDGLCVDGEFHDVEFMALSLGKNGSKHRSSVAD